MRGYPGWEETDVVLKVDEAVKVIPELKRPKIGDVITPAKGLELCRVFELTDLVNRLSLRGSQYYEDWVYDGCSMIPDQMLCEAITKQCLKHDLKYMYGERGKPAERKRADQEFFLDLVNNAHTGYVIAVLFYSAVRLFGAEKFNKSFSWGAASKLNR